MKTKIEETKLTPEILNAICRRCEESVGDDTFGPFGKTAASIMTVLTVTTVGL